VLHALVEFRSPLRETFSFNNINGLDHGRLSLREASGAAPGGRAIMGQEGTLMRCKGHLWPIGRQNNGEGGIERKFGGTNNFRSGGHLH
jgi:hypothetical protein